MAWTSGAVSRKHVSLQRFIRIENQQNAFSNFEPHASVRSVAFAHEFEAHDIAVECLGSIQVGRVDGGFKEMMDGRHDFFLFSEPWIDWFTFEGQNAKH